MVLAHQQAPRAPSPIQLTVEQRAELQSKVNRLEDFTNMQDVAYTLTVLDRGMERARLLWNGQAPWAEQKGRKIYGMYSALDGSVQPYGVNVPDSYDGSKLVRLYVWLPGLTINEREYRADYSLPRWGDFAVLQFQPQPIVALAGLFDESWRLPVQVEP